MELPRSQFARLERMRRERHFLLDAKTVTKESNVVCTLEISGSTGNIYTITLSNDGMQCDCPDFFGNANADQIYCKHCCFVIYRVLASNIDCEEVQPRQLKHQKVAQWQAKLTEISQRPLGNVIQHKSVVDIDLACFGIIKQTECKFPNRLEDSCGVCYEDLKGTSTLIECGECFNLVHIECADFWLRNGTVESCVYCRSLLPYALYLQDKEQRASKRQKKTGEYRNILD